MFTTPDIAELRICDEDYQTLICSSYHPHEDEEFKVEYWGRAVEIACLLKSRTCIQVRDLERLFSEQRKMQVKLPSLFDVFGVLLSRDILAPEPTDWFSEHSRGMVKSTAIRVKNWFSPPSITTCVVMPIVMPLVDKVVDTFSTEPFFFEDVTKLLQTSKQDTNVVLCMLLQRHHPTAQPFELQCGSRRLRGIRIGGPLCEGEKALVLQKYAANELTRREDVLSERIIASDKKARYAVRERHPKELILLELRVKKHLLNELEKLKMLSLQVQQAETNLAESHMLKTVLDALELSTSVTRSNMDINAAERVMDAKNEMEDLQAEMRDLFKSDTSEIEAEVDALMAEEVTQKSQKTEEPAKAVVEKNEDPASVCENEPVPMETA